MTKVIVTTLCCVAIVALSGCDQEELTANKSSQETVKAKGYVETLAKVHKESQENIQDAVDKENSKLEEALETLDGDTSKNEEKSTSSNNSQQQLKTMSNIPEQINMEFAQTCKSATLKTNKGDITIEFYNEDAPVTVANFCTLADGGKYDNVIFHRVIKDFMIQGGDPEGTGMGGPGYEFDDEIHANNRNDVGTIAMANAGPGTNGSQFFINTKANNFLDTKHTVFGKVTKGMDTVTAIEETAVGAGDKPVQDVIIESIQLENN